ncbi:ABC transporter substrate-binding protein [Pseudomonas mangiferae]|uniref:ABC transporter substrate-binding protein n=2 Tax=Pseudomonas mangiferae TaxID=2593654 RepID=A0A553H4Y9_9PSED|nr:ABC transporter substrate-binding protein [Pseudomonas mangiferae]
MMRRLLALAWLAWVLPAQAVAGQSFANCGETWRVSQPPRRILALNQHAADLLLALDAGPALLGVAYIDDDPQALASRRYHGVPLVAARYPTAEALYALQPDLVVGGFASAFGQGLLARRTLAEQGIGSYLLDAACARRADQYFTGIETDLRTLGALLGREALAERLIRQQAGRLAEAKRLARLPRRPTVFYLDSVSHGLDSEGGRGFVDELLRAAGATHLFGDLPLGRTAVSRETLLLRDPDVLLLADAVWSPAADKIAYLQDDPTLSTLRAVRNACWVRMPFSHLVPSVDSARAVEALARQLAALERCLAPPRPAP